jgi:hypothetical protein
LEKILKQQLIKLIGLNFFRVLAYPLYVKLPLSNFLMRSIKSSLINPRTYDKRGMRSHQAQVHPQHRTPR